jgi:hypothetical protein
LHFGAGFHGNRDAPDFFALGIQLQIARDFHHKLQLLHLTGYGSCT